MTKSTARRTYGKGVLSNAMRQKILKAQLRVTLDEELNRATPPEVLKLAALPMPRLSRVEHTGRHQATAGPQAMSSK